MEILSGNKMGCLTGDTVIAYRVGTRRYKNTLSLKDFYLYFNLINDRYNKCPKYIKNLVGSNAHYSIAKEVLHKGLRQVRTIYLENGFSVTTTADYKIGINYSDFRVARELMEGDLVRVCLEDDKIDLVRIESFSTWSEQTVYDIVCNESHFLANRVHVHN